MQKFIDIALIVLKIFKAVKPTIFPMKFDTKQAFVNGVKGNNARVHPRHFCS